ncbi:MAG: hypothetical protein L0G25_07875, partial [Psychrobacter sp.]|nr:hypothetical protein [Psychrobacter sp.]
MSDVISCKLKDLFHSSVSGEWGTNPFNGGNSLVLRAADFTKDCKLRNSIGAARTIPLDKLGTRALRNGDILIEKSGGSPEQPVGRVAYFDRQNSKQTYSHSNFLQLLRVAEEFDSHYAYYLMAFLYNEGLVYKYQQ